MSLIKNMKTTTIAIFCLFSVFFAPLALAQSTDYAIKGRLVDHQGGFAVAFELVTFQGKKVLTDENGVFSFSVPATGNYELEAGGLNYELQLIKEIEISLGKPVHDLGSVPMKQKALTLPTTTIMGTTDEGGSGTRISEAQLRQRQPVGTEEMLKTVPAVIVAGDMGISNRLNVGIRGSYPRRSGKILLLEDGVPIAPAPYLGPEAYYNPPAERLDGIEVIKGAELVAYGPQTMYGAVNYLTRKPPVTPRLFMQLAAGENQYRSAFVSYGGTWGHTGAEVQLLRKHFGGFQDNTASDIYNFTGKLFSFLSAKSSLYAKVNLHHELSQATYSGLTPLTFAMDPRQNPFDADILNTERYALDLKHNYQAGSHLVFTTLAYGSSFTRDWWRQNTTLINAGDALTYLGEDIFNDRYAYLDGGSFSDDDYVRVGRLSGGRESTLARDRKFTVGGLSEQINWKWGAGQKHELTAGLRLHAESWLNQEFASDSTRFGNTGTNVEDDLYKLIAGSAFAMQRFSLGKLSLTPGLRAEYVRMTKFEKLDASQDPDYVAGSGEYLFVNTFPVLLPGLNARYEVKRNAVRGNSILVFGGAYRGYTPPTNEVGFNAVNEEGLVQSTDDNALINMKPESSFNHEAGIEWTLRNTLQVQGTWFMQNIQNFYAAGRREAFETLGRVQISGAEWAVNVDVARLAGLRNQKISLGASGAWMQSRIGSGRVADTDLFRAKHTDETRNEIADRINETPGGFEVYYAAADGSDSLVSRPFTGDDVKQFKKVNLVFGESGITDQQAPYVPAFSFTTWLNYEVKQFTLGLSFTWVGKQYTDYLNLEHETADGAMGSLPAYHNLDVNAGYTFAFGQNHKLTLFLAAKNLTNEVYRASRLHRVSSGIMPGGFRQVNGGLTLEF